MNVLLVTILVSLLLAVIFILLFLGERSRRGASSPEKDALLPLDGEEEKRRPSPESPGNGVPRRADAE